LARLRDRVRNRVAHPRRDHRGTDFSRVPRQGTIWIAPGMTREQVVRRASTRIGQYGDSGRFVDVVLVEEGMRLHGIQQFMLSPTKDGRIDYVSMISANETWPDLVRTAKRTEAILIARGWKPAPGQRGVESLPSRPRDAAADVTGSGAIAGASFTWTKGRQEFTLAAGGLWSGIPWFRNARGAEVFWRNMTYVPLGDPDETQSEALP
jgi:hypothetical protein